MKICNWYSAQERRKLTLKSYGYCLKPNPPPPPPVIPKHRIHPFVKHLVSSAPSFRELKSQTSLNKGDLKKCWPFLLFHFSKSCLILQRLMIMLYPHSPKYNDKPDAEQWIDNPWKLFQSLDLISVVLLQFFISVIFLKCLFLLLLIDIDKLSPPEIQL